MIASSRHARVFFQWGVGVKADGRTFATCGRLFSGRYPEGNPIIACSRRAGGFFRRETRGQAYDCTFVLCGRYFYQVELEGK